MKPKTAENLCLAGVFGLLLCFVAVVDYVSFKKNAEDGEKCRAAGGEWVAVDRRYLCMRPGIVIDLKDTP